MTRSDLLGELYRRLGYATSPASEVSRRLGGLIEEALQDLYSEPGLGGHLSRHQPSLTFASVADQAVYSLPPGVPRVDAIRETTNDRKLEMRSHDWYRRQEPDPAANTGTPSPWVPLGFSAVNVQPSDASEIFVDS